MWLLDLLRRAGRPPEGRPARVVDPAAEPDSDAAGFDPAAPTVRPSCVIVGLGNPGAQYAATRHNVGFWVAEAAAERAGFAPEMEAAASIVGEGVLEEDGREPLPLAVALPQTFMNRSGAAVALLLERYALTPDRLLVVYDDLALPVGQIRLRRKGGAGGHNGVSSVIEALGSTEFPRLRLGVGDSFAPGRQVDHVLSPFAEDERETIDDAVERAAEAALVVARDGLTAAMNRFNQRG